MALIGLDRFPQTPTFIPHVTPTLPGLYLSHHLKRHTRARVYGKSLLRLHLSAPGDNRLYIKDGGGHLDLPVCGHQRK